MFDRQGDNYRWQAIRALQNARRELINALEEMKQQKGVGFEIAFSDINAQIYGCTAAIIVLENL